MLSMQLVNNYLLKVQPPHQCVISYNWVNPEYIHSLLVNNYCKKWILQLAHTVLYLSGDDNSKGSFNNNLLRGVLLRTIELLQKLEQPVFVGVSWLF